MICKYRNKSGENRQRTNQNVVNIFSFVLPWNLSKYLKWLLHDALLCFKKSFAITILTGIFKIKILLKLK